MAQCSKIDWPNFMSAAALQRYLPAELGLEVAAQGGYTHWYIDGSLQGERPADFTETRIERIRRRAAELGVQPIVHGNFRVPLGSDVRELQVAAIEYIKREIDLCEALGGVPLIVHGGGIVEPRSVRAARERGIRGLVDALDTIACYAARTGIPLWLENLADYKRFHPFYYLCTNQREYEQILAALPSVGFFLDVSHAHVNGGNPVAVFEKLSTRIVGMSFSDNHGLRDSHLPLGRGNLDFCGLVRSIMRIQWQGLVAFETRGSDLSDSVAFLCGMLALVSASPQVNDCAASSPHTPVEHIIS